MRAGWRRPQAGDQELNQFHKDLAYVAQAELGKGMIFLANRLHDSPTPRAFAMQRRSATELGYQQIDPGRDPLVEDMFIQRASTDDGNAIGCALYGWHELAKRESRASLRHVYLGATYAAAVIALEPGCGRF